MILQIFYTSLNTFLYQVVIAGKDFDVLTCGFANQDIQCGCQPLICLPIQLKPIKRVLVLTSPFLNHCKRVIARAIINNQYF